MAKIEIYTKAYCPYCVRAKHLLDSLNVEYTEIAIDGNSELRQVMINRSGGFTVPQIFINQQAIGGCDELHTLHRQGKLQPLLQTN